MKIGFVITDLTGDGGVERTTVLLANLFKEKGHSVSIISLFKRNTSINFNLDPHVKVEFLTNLTYKVNLSLLDKIRLLFSARNRLKRVLQNLNFDELISQTFLPTFLLASIGYAGYTTVCEHFKYGIYNNFATRIRNAIYKKCKNIVTLTPNDSLKFFHAGIENVVIPNMVTFPISFNNGQDTKRIISVGRLSNQKGFDMLIKSMIPVFEKYPEWKLDIYGEGQLYSELVNLTTDLNLSDNIFFRGFTNNIATEFKNSAFYVMSSRYEGFPMILLEAASQNLPCISFDCPEGPSEILRNGGGILVKSENISQLSNAIIEFIENKTLRNQCAKQALKNIEAFSPENIYIKWMTLFKN